MKIIARTRELLPPREWTKWEECRDTTGLSLEELEGLLHDWANEEANGRWVGDTFKMKSDYEMEEFKIVEDDLDVDSMNGE
jgi:hypothetical protein